MTSSNSPYTSLRDVDTHWIQDVVALIGNTGQPHGRLLNCTCAVCLESTLDISACVGDMIKDELAAADPVDSKRAFYEKYNLERAAFLPCGHVVGLTCLSKFERGQIGICPMCRDKSCDGCKWFFQPVLVSEIVPWPLSTAGYRPLPNFINSVTLTAAEIAPGTKRFCVDCMEGQFIREWFRLHALFPRCIPCEAVRSGSGAQYPADHRVWRDANVAEKDPEARRYCQRCTYFQILRRFANIALNFPACQKEGPSRECVLYQPLDRAAQAQQSLAQRVDKVGRLICPDTADLRDPQLAATYEELMVKGRDYVRAVCLGARGRSSKFHGAILCPCFEDINQLPPPGASGASSRNSGAGGGTLRRRSTRPTRSARGSRR